MKVFSFLERTSIQDFTTNELLGRGKYSVYKGEIQGSQQDCAIKIFPSSTQIAQNAYIRERRVMSGLRHDHIVNLIPNTKHMDQDKNYLLVMEYAPYGDFFDIIMSRELTDEMIIRTYFQQLVTGLKYLHSKGIAHLDLKLDNLLLGKDFQLKITDFDLAHDQKEANKPVSRGTTGYRAPEILDDQVDNIFAADVYSIGIILFICFTGEFPFVEKETTKGKELRDYDLFMNHNDRFWKKKTNYYDVCFSNELKDLFNGMLTKDPLSRFTVKDIEVSPWYQGQTVEKVSLGIEMGQIHHKIKTSPPSQQD